MPSSFRIINAPKLTTVAAADLATAMQNAIPGEVITVTAGDPLDLLFSGLVKSGYGICVEFPPEQLVTMTFTNGCSGIHLFGGTWSCDGVRGDLGAANNGLSIDATCSKISLQGAYLDRNANSVLVVNATDVSINNNRFNINRRDGCNFVTSQRLVVEDNTFDQGARGVKFCYFSNGDDPLENVSESECTLAGGTWEDTAHNDVVQYRDQCSDVILKDNVSNAYLSQGLITFGADLEDNYARNVLIDGNVLNDLSTQGIWIIGDNVDVRNNILNESPDSEGPPRINVSRIDVNSKLQGGNNVAPLIIQPPDLDLASLTINGDAGVVAPERPQIILPNWKPIVVKPDATPLAPPERITGEDGVRYSGNVEVGTWLTVNRGQWSGVDGVTWEYRWLRNGSPIVGATSQTYQLQAADVGASIYPEVRGTNAAGTGEWFAYIPAPEIPAVVGPLTSRQSVYFPSRNGITQAITLRAPQLSNWMRTGSSRQAGAMMLDVLVQNDMSAENDSGIRADRVVAGNGTGPSNGIWTLTYSSSDNAPGEEKRLRLYCRTNDMAANSDPAMIAFGPQIRDGEQGTAFMLFSDTEMSLAMAWADGTVSVGTPVAMPASFIGRVSPGDIAFGGSMNTSASFVNFFTGCLGRFAYLRGRVPTEAEMIRVAQGESPDNVFVGELDRYYPMNGPSDLTPAVGTGDLTYTVAGTDVGYELRKGGTLSGASNGISGFTVDMPLIGHVWALDLDNPTVGVPVSLSVTNTLGASTQFEARAVLYSDGETIHRSWAQMTGGPVALDATVTLELPGVTWSELLHIEVRRVDAPSVTWCSGPCGVGPDIIDDGQSQRQIWGTNDTTDATSLSAIAISDPCVSVAYPPRVSDGLVYPLIHRLIDTSIATPIGPAAFAKRWAEITGNKVARIRSQAVEGSGRNLYTSNTLFPRLTNTGPYRYWGTEGVEGSGVVADHLLKCGNRFSAIIGHYSADDLQSVTFSDLADPYFFGTDSPDRHWGQVNNPLGLRVFLCLHDRVFRTSVSTTPTVVSGFYDTIRSYVAANSSSFSLAPAFTLDKKMGTDADEAHQSSDDLAGNARMAYRYATWLAGLLGVQGGLANPGTLDAVVSNAPFTSATCSFSLPDGGSLLVSDGGSSVHGFEVNVAGGGWTRVLPANAQIVGDTVVISGIVGASSADDIEIRYGYDHAWGTDPDDALRFVQDNVLIEQVLLVSVPNGPADPTWAKGMPLMPSVGGVVAQAELIDGNLVVSNASPAEGDTITLSFELFSVHPVLNLSADNLICNPNSVDYQWKKNGVNVGTNNQLLTLTNVTSSDGGDYTLEVTDSVTSDVRVFGPVSLSVVPAVPPGFSNLTTITNAGWDIPDPAEWYINHPSAATVKSSLVEPFQNDVNGLCIKRFWLPHTLVDGQFDAAQMAVIINSANSMQRRAIASWYANDILMDTGLAATRMAEAKTAFNTQCDAKISSGTPFPSFIVASVGTRDELAALFALDWIRWDDSAEFEAAFDKVKTLIENNIAGSEVGGRNWRYDGVSVGEGYWNASHYSTTAYYLESLLAFGVHGINPLGASHAWADSVIDRMGLDPRFNESAVFSPFDSHNAKCVLSLGNGGGREWGAADSVTSLGGYELNLAWWSTVVPKAIDTATNSTFSLVDKSLYLNTRWVGLAAIEDTTVEITGFHPDCGAMVDIWARLFSSTTVGARYSWLSDRTVLHTNATSDSKMRELIALAGVKPVGVAPTGEFADRVGSRWYYVANRASPESDLRCMIHNRSIDCHREMGDARVIRFAVGNVGLVEGHANRSAPNGALSNGIWWGNKAASGDPIIATSGWWSLGMSQGVYHTPLRTETMNADPLLDDPRFLTLPQVKPVLNDGIYTWSQDWSAVMGIATPEATTPDSRLISAVSSFALDTVAKKLIIEDTIEIDLSDGLYCGWHFSPSHAVVIIDANTFEFSDGADTIRVTVEPLNGFTFTRAVKTGSGPFDLGYTTPGGDPLPLDLEWHNTGNGGSLNRIAANVGYTPSLRLDNTYQVRVTIEANP